MFVKINSNNRVIHAVGLLPEGEDAADWITCDDAFMQMSGSLVHDAGTIRQATAAENAAEASALALSGGAVSARWKRDLLLVEADKTSQLDRWEGYTAEQRTAITAYKQALRDLPESAGFPLNITWPVVPVL